MTEYSNDRETQGGEERWVPRSHKVKIFASRVVDSLRSTLMDQQRLTNSRPSEGAEASAMGLTNEAASETRLRELKDIFRQKHEVISELRSFAIGVDPNLGLLILEGFTDRDLGFLRSNAGKSELNYWVRSFSGAFSSLDESFRELDTDIERERTAEDWLEAVEAQTLTLGALKDRVAGLVDANSDLDQSGGDS